MGVFGRRKDGINRSAHLKGGTAGTSNEVSFSVLDAARQRADEQNGAAPRRHLGSIPLFSLGGRRRPVRTPRKDRGLTLPGGGFVEGAELRSTVEEALASSAAATLGEANRDANIESSDALGVSGRTERKGRGRAASARWMHAGKGSRRRRKAASKERSAPALPAAPEAPALPAPAAPAASAAPAAPLAPPAASAAADDLVSKRASELRSELLSETPAGRSGRKRSKRSKRKRPALPAAPAPALPAGSAPAPAPASARTSAEDEVARRKRARRRAKISFGILSAAAVVALVCVGVLAAVRTMDAHVAQTSTVDGALAQVAEADEVIVELDALLSEPLEQESESEMDSCIASIPSAAKRLAAAKTAASTALEDMQLNSDKELVYNTQSAIDARLEMMEHGKNVLTEAKKALAAVAKVDAAWDTVLAADSSIRTAVNGLSQAAEADAVAAACEDVVAARSELVEAREQIVAVDGTYTADLSDFVSYLDARTAALDHAVAAAEALAEEDTELASAEIAEYNAQDTAAAQMARAMPTSPIQLVASIYEDKVRDDVDAYTAARLRAASYDEDLRARMGS